MGLSKSFKFSEQEIQTAAFAKALAHPARIAILRFLSNTNGCFCGDIVSHIPLAQATVSQHLQVLKSAGLIKGIIQGPKICYCISPEMLKESRKLFIDLLHTKSDCC